MGYLNWCWDFQRKTFTDEPCVSDLLRYFSPAFLCFICSQHPLSAQCWARQEPCESWSELLNAGVCVTENSQARQSPSAAKTNRMHMYIFYTASAAQIQSFPKGARVCCISPKTLSNLPNKIHKHGWKYVRLILLHRGLQEWTSNLPFCNSHSL